MKNQQELIDEYLYYCLKQRKLDEKTVRAYRIDLRQFSEFCVQKKLVTEKAIIRQYILHLHESYKQKTVKRKVASIKAFYSYLEDEEIIDDSPLRKIRTEFREEKILPRSIPYSILQSLLSSMYSKKSIESTISEKKLLNRDIAVVETLFSTGIRISELCNLMQKNIDIEQGIFCIKGKGGKERYLQIGTGEVLAQLKEYKRHWEKELNLSEFFFLYNTIVGGGENGCILHYTENESALRDGDLVLIDAGCEYQGYAGDITRTFPVNGKFSPAQRAIYDIVLESLETALTLYRPGTSIQEVTGEVVRIMITGLVKLGILKGDVDTLIAENAHRPYFMHGLSHWLGLDVHDVGAYGTDRSRVLEPGMVLTVEPGLYIAPDADVPEAYRGIGIRIEDDIVITETGNENLTASVVKHADDIEALMAAARV